MGMRTKMLQMTAEEKLFLQQRVSLYARVAFAIVATFFVLDMAGWYAMKYVVGEQVQWPNQLQGMVTEAGIAVGLLLASIFAKRVKSDVLPLYVFDGFVTLMVASSFSLLVYHAPSLPVSIELMVFLAIQMLLFVHAAVVPSPPIRTFFFHSLACVPLVLVVVDRSTEQVVTDSVQKWASPVVIATWGLAFAAVGAVVSRIVYNLRMRVRKVERLGQYSLEKKLGEGGMGVVYRGRHAMLRRPTAIKLLPPSKAGETTVLRFEREVRQTSRLSHPNTVAIYDFGRTPDGIFYYAMELLEGPNLAQVVKMDGPLPPARVIHILVQCAGALAEAHDMGLVHRDVKPENIVLCKRGGVPDVVKVVDFGLVKDLGGSEEVKLSRADTLTGTPLYMAPEAITAPQSVDGRADLYALGGVAWFLLVGRPPFDGASLIEVCAKHLQDAPPSLSQQVDVSSDLEAVVLKLLAKNPEDRFHNAQELDDALRACEEADRWTRKNAALWWDTHMVAVSEVLHSQSRQQLTIDLDRS